MTLRRGMSGDAVKRIQEFLGTQKLYLGPVDSSFGGGLEAAVKTYQNQHGIPPSGLVDPVTWTRMFPDVPPPVSEIAARPLLERCVALTGSFETSRFPPDCFSGLSGDFDKMGISFGALQWNVGQNTLQPLLRKMFGDHTDVARNIFHEHFDTITALHSSSLDEQLTFARSVQSRGMVEEPWHGMLVTLGRTPEFQAIQVGDAAVRFKEALSLCADYGLHSERAAALLFDIVVQGSISSIVRAQILADFKQLPANDPANEVAKMRIVANRKAASSRPEFVDDVRTRKLTIAEGAGTVHGTVYDLADMFNLTLNPYAQSVTAATSA